jgi:hypothetical protein
MRVFQATRHGLMAGAEGLLLAAIIAAILLALAPVYGPAKTLSGTGSAAAAAPGAFKFALAVDHPEGTVLNDNEVVYTARLAKGGLGGNASYAVWHRCYGGGEVIVDQLKGLWFGNGSKVGDAYFLTFGDRCTGVVVDYGAAGTASAAAAAPLSNTVDYGTDPLP